MCIWVMIKTIKIQNSPRHRYGGEGVQGFTPPRAKKRIVTIRLLSSKLRFQKNDHDFGVG